MRVAKHEHPQTSKRKAEDELPTESTKKPKIGPTTIPPVRKRGGFMQSIQLPGFTAAEATVSIATSAVLCQLICMQNIKHVKEKIKVPIACEPQPSLEVGDGVPGPSRTNAQKLTSGRRPQKDWESPLVEGAEASTSAKKRPRGDDPEMGTSKKVKVCHPQVS